jgi:hypothetical protein
MCFVDATILCAGNQPKACRIQRQYPASHQKKLKIAKIED